MQLFLLNERTRQKRRQTERERERHSTRDFAVVVMRAQCNAAVATVLFGYCAMNIIIIMVTIVGIRQINMFLQ